MKGDRLFVFVIFPLIVLYPFIMILAEKNNTHRTAGSFQRGRSYILNTWVIRPPGALLRLSWDSGYFSFLRSAGTRMGNRTLTLLTI